MRVVNLNTWCGRIRTAPSYLQSLNADVYCLQEITSGPEGIPDYLHYEGQGSTPEAQRTRFMSDLIDALPGYQAFYLPAVRGYLHDGAQVKEPVFYGIATFVRDTVPVVGHLGGFVYGEYRPRAWGDPPLPRNAHVVRLFDYQSGSYVTIAHMHGMWMSSGKGDTPERSIQARRFSSLIQRAKVPHDQVIACGDWNVMPGSETLRTLAADHGLDDLVTSRGHDDTRTSLYKKFPRYADYMMVTHHVHVKNFDVPAKPEVSDHRPLILDF